MTATQLAEVWIAANVSTNAGFAINADGMIRDPLGLCPIEHVNALPAGSINVNLCDGGAYCLDNVPLSPTLELVARAADRDHIDTAGRRGPSRLTDDVLHLRRLLLLSAGFSTAAIEKDAQS